jgi:acylphosphatase
MGTEMESTNSRIHVFISGLVQGVGFRFFVYQYGINLNLRGWVRNRYNGQVEVMAEGRNDILDAFIEKIKEGPQMAHVDDIEVEWYKPTNELPEFTILATE